MLSIQNYVPKHYPVMCKSWNHPSFPMNSRLFNQWFCVTRVLCSWETRFFATGQNEHKSCSPWKRKANTTAEVSLNLNDWPPTAMSASVLWEVSQTPLSAKLPATAAVKPITVMGRKCPCWIVFLICICRLHPHLTVGCLRQWISVISEWLKPFGFQPHDL